MTVAQLGIVVDTAGLEKANSELNKLPASAGKAEGAASKFSREIDRLITAMTRIEVGILEVNKSVNALPRAAVQAETAIQKLGKTTGMVHGYFVQLNGASAVLNAGLNTLGQAAAKTDAALNKASAAVNSTGRAAAVQAPAVAKLTKEVQGLDRASQFARNNLRYQAFDVAQTLALGMNPLMVAMQQGPQIAQIYGPNEGGVGRAFKELGGMVLGLITPVTVLGAAFVGLGVAASKAVGEAGRLKDLSKTLNTTLEDAQKLERAFSRLDNETFTKGISSLGGTASKAISDKDSQFARLFSANNQSFKDAQGNLKSINDLLGSASSLISNAKNEFDKIEIARIIGLSEEWISILEKGPASIAQAKAEAALAGVVFDQAFANKASRFEEQWDKAWISFRSGMQRAFYEAGIGFSNLVGWALEIMRMPDRLGENINDALRKRFKAYDDLNLSMGESPLGASRVVTDLEKGKNILREMFKDPTLSSTSGKFAESFTQSVLGGAKSGKKDGTKIPPPNAPKSTKERMSEFDREIRSIQERTKAIEAESQVIGLSTFEKEKVAAITELENKARRDAIGLTPERISQIEKEATAYAKVAAEQEKLQEAQRQLDEIRDAGRENFKGLVTDIINGESAIKSLANAFQNFANKLLDLALDDLFDSIFSKAGSGGGGGGIGGLLGSVGNFFSSLVGREHGGSVSRGKPYIVGEKRPELFIPNQSGTIVPKLPEGGGSTVVNFSPATTVNIQGDGNAAQISAALDARDRKMMAQVKAQLPSLIKDAQRRGHLR